MEHQRATTYELSAGHPTEIDLQTNYLIPRMGINFLAPFFYSEPAKALTGTAHAEARMAEVQRPTEQVLQTKGLIRIDGDRMTYIVSNPGGPRPTSFDTAPGDGLTKVTLVRVK